jgi:integrase
MGLGLWWEDVDLGAGTLHVRHALQRVAGTLTLVEPKTRRSRRTVAMPAPIVTALRADMVRQIEERLFAGSRWQDTGFDFTTMVGTPLDGTAVTKRFQAILKQAGLPHQRFHDLRHCCASLLLAQGVHARVVMEILGHSQIGLTMDTYSHVMPAMQREPAALMDDILTAPA